MDQRRYTAEEALRMVLGSDFSSDEELSDDSFSEPENLNLPSTSGTSETRSTAAGVFTVSSDEESDSEEEVEVRPRVPPKAKRSLVWKNKNLKPKNINFPKQVPGSIRVWILQVVC